MICHGSSAEPCQFRKFFASWQFPHEDDSHNLTIYTGWTRQRSRKSLSQLPFFGLRFASEFSLLVALKSLQAQHHPFTEACEPRRKAQAPELFVAWRDWNESHVVTLSGASMGTLAPWLPVCLVWRQGQRWKFLGTVPSRQGLSHIARWTL
jgi:hypothetical protein